MSDVKRTTREWVKVTIHCTNMDLVYNIEIKNKSKNGWWVIGKREFDIPTNAGLVKKITGNPPAALAPFAGPLYLPSEETETEMAMGNASVVLNKKYCTLETNSP